MGSDNPTQRTFAEAQALKDSLFERAKFGQITGDEADAEAVKLGLEPLASTPSPDSFDPMAEANWTLPMAVSWIAHRTPDAVRRAWPAHCEQCWHWIWRQWRNGPDGDVHEGWFLEQYRFPSLPLIELAEIVDRIEGSPQPSPMMTASEARESLWIALGEGMLPVTAVPRQGGPRVTIPPEEWPGLAPKDSDHRDELSGNGFSLAYVDMLVPSRAMTQLWGPRREARASLPPTVRPDGFGYMPLSCAAQWIATEGGTSDFDPADEAIWKRAFNELLAAIASDEVRVVGMKNGGLERVPGISFAGIVVDYPFAEATHDMITSEVIYLRCYPYTNEEQWRKTFHDSLVTRHRNHWSHLQVEKGDVRQLWSFGANAAPVATGAPGRPSSMHLILDEFERRADRKELAPQLRAEATALVDWLRTTHPQAKRPTVKTVENRIRAEYRSRKAAPK